MAEETEQLDPELRELQEEMSILVSLTEHRGYRHLMQIAHEQLETRKQEVFLKPLEGLDETWKQEYMKGEIAGIALFMSMTDVRLQLVREDINTRLSEEEQENLDEQSEPGSSAP